MFKLKSLCKTYFPYKIYFSVYWLYSVHLFTTVIPLCSQQPDRTLNFHFVRNSPQHANPAQSSTRTHLLRVICRCVCALSSSGVFNLRRRQYRSSPEMFPPTHPPSERKPVAYARLAVHTSRDTRECHSSRPWIPSGAVILSPFCMGGVRSRLYWSDPSDVGV